MAVPIIWGPFRGCPYSKSPTSLWSKLAPLTVGNPALRTAPGSASDFYAGPFETICSTFREVGRPSMRPGSAQNMM